MKYFAFCVKLNYTKQQYNNNMSKDKKRRKFLQGMEHLRQQVQVQSQSGTAVIPPQEGSIPLDAKIIKTDLLRVLIIIGSFVVILVAIMLIDKKTEYINDFAIKLTNLVIK